MIFSNLNKTYFLCLSFIVPCFSNVTFAEESIEFNVDLLDLDDRNNIDLSHFERPGYIMPGTYTFKIRLNNETIIDSFPVTYDDIMIEGDEISTPCLSHNLIQKLGLKSKYLKKVTSKDQHCLPLSILEGAKIKGNLSNETLNITLPQTYLEYRSANWDPSALWDNGIPGIIFDYNVNTQYANSQKNSENSYRLNGNGVLGANYHNLRFRGDWQFNKRRSDKASNSSRQNEFKFSRLYAYMALPTLNAKLSAGENYLNSEVFDSYRYIGISLNTDLQMLPPSLRGYAAEVTGVANSNATVIIRQAGRVIYQTQVAQGPFRIQDLPSGISGPVDVTIEEDDGSVQQYQVNTTNIPYLTRPGQLRYNLSIGKPSLLSHQTEGDNFFFGDFSWGINNGMSILGGTIYSEHYQAYSLGLGQDLNTLGVIAFDLTETRANFTFKNEKSKGRRLRVNYSKRFDDYHSQFQFSGYRYFKNGYLNMSEYLYANENEDTSQQGNTSYAFSYHQTLASIQTTLSLNYDRQSYQDGGSGNRYTFNATKAFDMGSFKNIHFSFSAYRQLYNKNQNENGVYASLSIPLDQTQYMGGSISHNSNSYNYRANYSYTPNKWGNYQLSIGESNTGTNISAYTNQQTNFSKITGNASYVSNDYFAIGAGMRGGITVTFEGADLHQVSRLGGTRLLVDTNGVKDIPVQIGARENRSNTWGKIVIADIAGYHKSKVKVNINDLPDQAEINQSVLNVTLTEGAIGYKQFKVLFGEKRLVSLQMGDGTPLPFGASIYNEKGLETGIVDDYSIAYISGIKPNESMIIKWEGVEQCQIQFPSDLKQNYDKLKLTCFSTI